MTTTPSPPRSRPSSEWWNRRIVGWVERSATRHHIVRGAVGGFRFCCTRPTIYKISDRRTGEPRGAEPHRLPSEAAQQRSEPSVRRQPDRLQQHRDAALYVMRPVFESKDASSLRGIGILSVAALVLPFVLFLMFSFLTELIVSNNARSICILFILATVSTLALASYRIWQQRRALIVSKSDPVGSA